MATTQLDLKHTQSGNVFLIILIGIAMFTALMFTFSRGMQQGTEGMTGREAELAASDVVSYGQQVQRGVERLVARGISEQDISFANDFETGYDNPNCVGNNKCLIFNPEGGAVGWEYPPAGVNYTSATYFIGPNRVGSADNTTKNIATPARDLAILLPVTVNICEAINAITNKLPTWESDGTPNSTTKFIGNYDAAAGTVIANGNNVNQPATGCFCDGTAPCDAADPHFFYNVLLAR